EVGTEITRVAAFVAAAHASSTRPVAITREPIGIAFAPVRPRRAGLDRIAVGGRDVRADVLRFGGRRRRARGRRVHRRGAGGAARRGPRVGGRTRRALAGRGAHEVRTRRGGGHQVVVVLVRRRRFGVVVGRG